MMVGSPPFVDEDPMGIYQKILSGKIIFPKYFDKHCKAVVKRLLTADLGRRYGNLKNGVNDVKDSKWFSQLNWSHLLSHKIPAPYLPPVSSPIDTSNFEDYPDSTEIPPKVAAHADP